eukprot:gnl/TRDRNA2_/TRDRNA2_172932_c7_seq9.p1 gnl/TRDRNA2_/TRDRNA2_172932_c7~~gnl/TRDRNA2_/TRDRNA2_172932_c7_seq9.p1  ORF type:complete len:162 (-),score=24.50 gnl/TRDRNA2_/TRDRNA2_172932_c7_seq9:70-516(-)
MPDCLYVATAKENLQAHNRSQHSENGGRDFPCDILPCSYVAKRHADLKGHKRSKHSKDAVCDLPCDELSFAISGDLKSRRWEDDYRDFACDMPGCPHVATTKKNLRAHHRSQHSMSSVRDIPPDEHNRSQHLTANAVAKSTKRNGSGT